MTRDIGGPVLAFFPVIETGGLEIAASRILNGLAESGCDVTLFNLRCDPASDGLFSARIRRVRAGALRLPLPFLNPKLRGALGVLPALWRHLVRARPAVILSFQSTTACLAVAKPLGVPVVHRESLDISRAMGGQPFQHRLVMTGKRLAYRACAAIVTNSEGSRAALARVADLPRTAIDLVYNPVDPRRLAALAAGPLSSGPVGEAFAAGVPVFVASGRLAAEKDHATLLRAFAMVAAEHDIRLVLAGAGRLDAELRALAAVLGVGERVAFAGHLENPHPVVTRAAAYVLSSRTEGLPNALLEAVALGVPCISTDCPSGPREILLDGAGGLLAPVGDAKALAGCLRAVLEHPDAARARAAAATAGLSRFLPETVIARYADVLARAARETP